MNILLPFFDDSTLFLAIKTYNKLISYENNNIIFLDLSRKNELSERQLSILNNSHVVYKFSLDKFYDAKFLSNFDLVIYSRLPISSFNKRKLINANKYFTEKRPYFLSMVSGIDITPELGIRHRYDADGLSYSDEIINEKYKEIIGVHQKIHKFHPFFCINKEITIPQQITTIYFFSQAVLPDTLSERINIIKMLITMCKKYPDKNIFIKLRHLKEENKNHIHKEIFSYEDILKICSQHEKIPNNLKLCTKNMAECLQDADYCITCSSTAGIESLCEGIPTAFYLEFPFNKSQKEFVENLKLYYNESGLLYTKNEIIDLVIKKPNPKWIAEKLCNNDDINEIFETVKSFTENYIYTPSEYCTSLSPKKEKNNFNIKQVSKLVAIEFFLIKLFDPYKLNKFKQNRTKFFIDSKKRIINLYWEFIGSKFK